MARKKSTSPNPAADLKMVSPTSLTPANQPAGKLGLIVGLLRREEGATIDQLVAATGWQRHSVRGAISGGVKKRLGLLVGSDNPGGVRIYRIAGERRP